MAKNTNELIKKAAELFNQEKFDDVITLLTDELLKKLKNAELYVWRGNAWYNKKDDQSKNPQGNHDADPLVVLHCGISHVRDKRRDAKVHRALILQTNIRGTAFRTDHSLRCRTQDTGSITAAPVNTRHTP